MESDIRIASLPALFEAVNDVYLAFENQPWWRGHGDSSWHLVPRVHRTTNRGMSYEANVATKFSRMAPTRYANCPPAEDNAAWLVLMQHYGLPTRLLDWTESPLIALYFAIANEKRDEEDGAIWGLDPYMMNELYDQPGILKLRHAQVNRLVGLAFTRTFPDDEAVLALAADEVDIRMLVQLSGMTIHGSRGPLEARDQSYTYLRKYTVEKNEKAKLRTELKKLGIRERNLFPDLEHLASDLRRDTYPD